MVLNFLAGFVWFVAIFSVGGVCGYFAGLADGKYEQAQRVTRRLHDPR